MKELIRKILREQTETESLCIPIDGWKGTKLSSSQVFGACRKTCIEKDVDDNCVDWDNCGRLHRGVDLTANSGTPLLAAASGTVITATSDDGGICGGQIVIQHADGIKTMYCHCSAVSAKKDQVVKRGEEIGKSGGDASDPGNGNSSHAHLHYQVTVNGTPVDPKAAGYLDVACVDSPDENLYDRDDPIALLIWLNQGTVKPKEDKRTPQELIALLPDCSKKDYDDMREDALALVKLWQWGYIELPRKDVNLYHTPDPANITGLLDYQKTYGLQELPVDIVNGCRIPQETLDHINANEEEIITNEL